MLLYWIWYALLPEFAYGQKAALLEQVASAKDIFFMPPEKLKSMRGINRDFFEAIRRKDLEPARKVLEQCDMKDIQILPISDPAYPWRLKNIDDPPMVLYYKGVLPDWDNTPTVSIVGTRSASAYGLAMARRMGYEVAACGGLVVSGCAAGIDALSLEGALATGAPVVGILGCGVDVVYPRTSRYLYESIPGRGCLMSEYPPGTRPFKWNFPQRNRLLSGIANAVLVVEAPVASGALITVQHAADQGRDVFVIPGNIDVPSCRGSNNLLQDGVGVALSGWDILQSYIDLYPDKIHPPVALKTPAPPQAQVAQVARAAQVAQVAQVAQPVTVPKASPAPQAKKDRKDIDNGEKSHYSDKTASLPALAEEESAMVKHLRPEPRPLSDIITEMALSSTEVMSILTRLTLKGVVQIHPGMYISLKDQ